MLTCVVFGGIIKPENNENHSKRNREEIWEKSEHDMEKEIWL